MKNCQQHQRELKQALKSRGLKITAGRLLILDIFKHAIKPLSIKEIARRLAAADIDLVTVYRTIESLAAIGYIKPIRLSGRQTYYESVASGHHHHLVCQRCGKIRDIQDCIVPVASPKFLKAVGFAKIIDHSLEFFGLCRTCA